MSSRCAARSVYTPGEQNYGGARVDVYAASSVATAFHEEQRRHRRVLRPKAPFPESATTPTSSTGAPKLIANRIHEADDSIDEPPWVGRTIGRDARSPVQPSNVCGFPGFGQSGRGIRRSIRASWNVCQPNLAKGTGKKKICKAKSVTSPRLVMPRDDVRSGKVRRGKRSRAKEKARRGHTHVRVIPTWAGAPSTRGRTSVFSDTPHRSIPSDVALRLSRELDELCSLFGSSSRLEASLASLLRRDGASQAAAPHGEFRGDVAVPTQDLLGDSQPVTADSCISTKGTSLVSTSGANSASTCSTLSLCECSACISSGSLGYGSRCIRRTATCSESRLVASDHRRHETATKPKVRRKLSVAFDEFECALFAELFAADDEGHVDWDAWDARAGYNTVGCTRSEKHRPSVRELPIGTPSGVAYQRCSAVAAGCAASSSDVACPTRLQSLRQSYSSPFSPGEVRGPAVGTHPGDLASSDHTLVSRARSTDAHAMWVEGRAAPCVSCAGKDAYVRTLLLQVSQLRSQNEKLHRACKAEPLARCWKCRPMAGLTVDRTTAHCAFVTSQAAATHVRFVDLLFGKSKAN